MTRDQALAFVGTVLGNKNCQSHLEAVLGYGQVPGMAAFDSNSQDSIERCESALDYMKGAISLLLFEVQSKPRQGELNMQAEDNQEIDDGSEQFAEAVNNSAGAS